MKRVSEPEDRNLILFYLITIAFTWFFWISEILAMQGRLGSSIFIDFLLSPNNPAAWGPFVGALVLTLWKKGKEGVFELLKNEESTPASPRYGSSQHFCSGPQSWGEVSWWRI